jgi:hypothetical protein
MILFNTWTEAELAVEAENGTTHLGGTKPMVVKFADPPKRDGPIVGIAPKKLFVGQVGHCIQAVRAVLWRCRGSVVMENSGEPRRAQLAHQQHGQSYSRSMSACHAPSTLHSESSYVLSRHKLQQKLQGMGLRLFTAFSVAAQSVLHGFCERQQLFS